MSPPGLLHTSVVFHSWPRASPSFDGGETQAREGREMTGVLPGVSSILSLHVWKCEHWKGLGSCCGMTKHTCPTSCRGPRAEAGIPPPCPLPRSPTTVCCPSLVNSPGERESVGRNHFSLCPSPDLSFLFLRERLGRVNSQKCASTKLRSWSLSNKQVGKNENANYLRESLENESADWATRQPVGAEFFFKRIMTYSRGFQPCTHTLHRQQK